jgi:cell division protein FtsN
LPRYFEIIITGRQLAALVVSVALAIAVAFGLGVGVRMLQPEPLDVATVAPVPTPVWQPTPPAIPAAVPTPEVIAAPAPAPPPVATERPKAVPTGAAAAKAEPRWVQVAALGKREQAEGVRNRVVALGYTPRQVLVQSVAGGKFRVRVGPFPDVESAGRVAARLRAEGFGGAFVVSE